MKPNIKQKPKDATILVSFWVNFIVLDTTNDTPNLWKLVVDAVETHYNTVKWYIAKWWQLQRYGTDQLLSSQINTPCPQCQPWSIYCKYFGGNLLGYSQTLLTLWQATQYRTLRQKGNVLIVWRLSVKVRLTLIISVSLSFTAVFKLSTPPVIIRS